MKRPIRSHSANGLTTIQRGELNVLVQRLKESVDMLRAFEWAGNTDDMDTCPICGKGRIAGHALDCKLAFLLTPPKL